MPKTNQAPVQDTQKQQEQKPESGVRMRTERISGYDLHLVEDTRIDYDDNQTQAEVISLDGIENNKRLQRYKQKIFDKVHRYLINALELAMEDNPTGNTELLAYQCQADCLDYLEAQQHGKYRLIFKDLLENLKGLVQFDVMSDDAVLAARKKLDDLF